MLSISERAWNNFVLQTGALSFDVSADKRAAAIAALFLASVNNGGMNGFLTGSYDYDAAELRASLATIGAFKSAQQLDVVLRALGESLARCSQDARWDQLNRLWREEMDRYDTLSAEANQELLEALKRHVSANEAYYLTLGDHG